MILRKYDSELTSLAMKIFGNETVKRAYYLLYYHFGNEVDAKSDFKINIKYAKAYNDEYEGDSKLSIDLEYCSVGIEYFSGKGLVLTSLYISQEDFVNFTCIDID